MKTTLYFDYTRKRPDRAQIKEEWIEFVIQNPEKTVIQSDGRIRKWSKITEVNKYLRVILLDDGTPIKHIYRKNQCILGVGLAKPMILLMPKILVVDEARKTWCGKYLA